MNKRCEFLEEILTMLDFAELGNRLKNVEAEAIEVGINTYGFSVERSTKLYNVAFNYWTNLKTTIC